MNSIKVIDLIKDLKSHQILYLRNFKNPSFAHAYKPIFVIPSGKEIGKLLLARWKTCSQLVMDLDSVLYYQY